MHIITGNNMIMEIIESDGKTRLCQRNNSMFPVRIMHVTATYTSGTILACGGYTFHYNLTGYKDQCYIYEKNKGWSKLSKMNQRRYGSASIPINGGMVVIGGRDGRGLHRACQGTLKSSQIILSNGSAVKEGPELPEPRYGHCLAYDKYDDVFFVTGGFYNHPTSCKPNTGPKTTVWKFSDPKRFILTGTSWMKEMRFNHGCAIFRSNKHSGRPLLVVAGCQHAGLRHFHTYGNGHRTCEFYDYTLPGSQWQLCSKSNSLLLLLNNKSKGTTKYGL